MTASIPIPIGLLRWAYERLMHKKRLTRSSVTDQSRDDLGSLCLSSMLLLIASDLEALHEETALITCAGGSSTQGAKLTVKGVSQPCRSVIVKSDPGPHLPECDALSHTRQSWILWFLLRLDTPMKEPQYHAGWPKVTPALYRVKGSLPRPSYPTMA